MAQHVLTVAGAVVKSTKQVDDPFIKAANAHFLNGLVAVSADFLFDFVLRLGHELFDPRWVDAAIGNELVERDPGNFAAHRVERAHDHDARRVVDNYVDAGSLFKRADVPPFAADDSAL